ncbi:zinc finger protein 740-like [Contarinia nasturtii]|uniref:zinc finger protein 740-like n=1 Tax=Contarinia nasturtii TaxID=265458 RepID=UPI0012D49F67|nr:zinc finger protein 740-like [Contarinia nasturtii]
MTPYQAKGASSRKTKNKCKCKHGRRESQVKVKQEIKEEPKDGAELIQYSPPPSPVAPSIVNIKSESESDNELVDIKIEIKCEGECSKKDCDSAKEAGNMNGNESNGPIGENQNAPKKNSNIDRKRRLREKKKARKGRSSKQPAAKGPKKHKCHFCDYASSYKSHITIHIRTHTGEKPFECEICALAFADQSNLNRHKKIHVPKCPFSCSKCRRGFTKEAEKINHENDCKAHQFFWICAFSLSVLLCGLSIQNTWSKWRDNPVTMSFTEKASPISGMYIPVM